MQSETLKNIWINTGEAYTRSAALLTMPEFISGYGVDPGALMDEAGIPRLAIKNGNLFVSFERQGRFLELAAQHCCEPDFGLKHALFVPKNYPNSGPIFLLSHFCKTLREWIHLASTYSAVYTNGYRPVLMVDENRTAIFRLQENPIRRIPRQMVEGLLTTLFLMVKEITQQDVLALKSVHFHHEAPARTDLHAEIYGCPVAFNAPYNQIVFDANVLDLPTRGGLGMFKAVMETYLRGQISGILPTQKTLGTAVFQVIAIVIGSELCTAAQVAQSLGMSEKKMQRLLNDEGESFRTILQNVREDMASKLLAQTSIPIDSVSEFLGYASNAAFTRAFTGWSNCTPSQYRRRQQNEAEAVDVL